MIRRAINGAAAVALAVLLAVMVYFDVIFAGQLPDHPLIYGWNDLILHTGAFGLLAVLVFWRAGFGLRIWAFLLCTASLFELAQIFIPEREVSLADLFANFAGVGLAAVFLVSANWLIAVRRAGRISA